MNFKTPGTLEKLSKILISIGAAGASAASGVAVPGVVTSSAITGAGLWASWRKSRKADAERVLEDTARDIETELVAWLKGAAELDQADLEHAITSFEEVIADCMPSPADVVGRNLGSQAIADLVLARAEELRPEVYKDTSPHNSAAALARRFLLELTERSYEQLLTNADFVGQLTPRLWQELLEGQDTLRQTAADIQADVAAIRETYAHELAFVRNDLQARESDLIALLTHILGQHVPRGDILSALENSYRKLADLRTNLSDLSSLANEEPDIAPLLKAVDEALQEGKGFSLHRAEQALAEADARFETLNKERADRYRRGEQNRARILGKRADIAAVGFDYTRAAELYEQQATCLVRAHGEDHEDVASAYNMLGVNLDENGNYRTAETFYRNALTIREDLLGKEHSDSIISLNNLAYNLNRQGRYNDAEPLYRQALEIRERVLGEAHPDTAVSYNNLASCLDDQGRSVEAEPLHQKALQIRKRILPENHPDIAMSYNNIAYNLSALGKQAEAETMYQKALEIFQKALGTAHPQTVRARENLQAIRSTAS